MNAERWLEEPEKAYNESLGLQEGDSTTFYQSRLELITEVCNKLQERQQ